MRSLSKLLYSLFLLWEVFLCLCLRQKCWKKEKCITDLCWKCHFRSGNKYFPINLSCTISILLRWRSPPSSWLESQDWSMFTYGSLSPSASCTWWPSWHLHHLLLHDQDRALTPCTHVLFPFHVGCLWPGTVPLIPPHCAADLCSQCYRNFPKCQLCSRIHYPWIHKSESSLLLVMAFVRFLAICNPLRYSSILPNARVAKMGLVFFIKSMP